MVLAFNTLGKVQETNLTKVVCWVSIHQLQSVVQTQVGHSAPVLQKLPVAVHLREKKIASNANLRVHPTVIDTHTRQ